MIELGEDGLISTDITQIHHIVVLKSSKITNKFNLEIHFHDVPSISFYDVSTEQLKRLEEKIE